MRTHECVKNGIRMLYEKNVSGALIVDSSEPDPTSSFTTSFSHPYVGFISFSNMVLWCLQVIPSFDCSSIFQTEKKGNVFDSIG